MEILFKKLIRVQWLRGEAHDCTFSYFFFLFAAFLIKDFTFSSELPGDAKVLL